MDASSSRGSIPRRSLQLRSRSHWECRGRPDSALFLASLGEVFAAATTLYVEGTSIAPDVRNRLTAASEPGPYLPARQTLWPRSERLRCRFDATLLGELAQLAEHQAEPELCDHLFVYAGDLPLLEYPDAFLRGSTVYVASSVAEDTLRAWAESLQLQPEWCAV